jgi:hypothetical protein
MTLPRKGRRSITVDGDVYHWVVRFERSGHVVIQHSTGQGPCLIVEPLDVMEPRHIADAVRFAIGKGWMPQGPQPNFWMGFNNDANQPRYEQILPNTKLF